MAITVSDPARQAPEAAVITKAVTNAAERLGLSARSLAAVLGVSEASISRMKRQDYLLERGSKSFELAVLFVRLFRSLDAIVGGDETVARQWLRNANRAFGAAPADKITTIAGLTDVLAYLDARRALV
ncbi:antitoxin Xre/MbcA/ParS toxin-binding domain-containing protein [Rhizobium sp. BK376]|uniref:antitoxin Xre/MbcA/ParS toxin-binding domain-containing protein n=1 Tax=Rhizobium sp. BK376 TaxID=2512149 RepID=UPI00104731E2|nr:antitoxin Xre/MbcA/ParS toxin-binding domain-containing protein [Rhizobium sp. BK376]TCR93349.1 RNA polymerase RpoN-/SigL-like sigma 54 subunit [Rhizobium sp. BK376]